ncbi:hypothetical protein AAFF_G00394500 [Aldrovandia affinis]|uniref:Uncharacterized protein n=1 Tax=Aldrovandia affinis TaxID=143900 RepID=A0AAD7SDN4_9TELE|nr:hypothetical protein AAFF_G00394500 [Aldrovandia affinis]
MLFKRLRDTDKPPAQCLQTDADRRGRPLRSTPARFRLAPAHSDGGVGPSHCTTPCERSRERRSRFPPARRGLSELAQKCQAGPVTSRSRSESARRGARTDSSGPPPAERRPSPELQGNMEADRHSPSTSTRSLKARPHPIHHFDFALTFHCARLVDVEPVCQRERRPEAPLSGLATARHLSSGAADREASANQDKARAPPSVRLTAPRIDNEVVAHREACAPPLSPPDQGRLTSPGTPRRRRGRRGRKRRMTFTPPFISPCAR